MSDLSPMLDALEIGLAQPQTAPERAAREKEILLASRFLARHAPDLHEMILGTPEPFREAV